MPGGVRINWGYISYRGGSNFDPTTVTFFHPYSATPYFAFAVQEKSDETRDNEYYGYIYSGTYRGPSNPDYSGIDKKQVTFSTRNMYAYRWICIGPA